MVVISMKSEIMYILMLYCRNQRLEMKLVRMQHKHQLSLAEKSLAHHTPPPPTLPSTLQAKVNIAILTCRTTVFSSVKHHSWMFCLCSVFDI